MRSEDRKGLFSQMQREYVESHSLYGKPCEEDASKKHSILKKARSYGRENLYNTLTDWNLLVDYLLSIDEEGTRQQLSGDAGICYKELASFIRKWIHSDYQIQLIKDTLIPPLPIFDENNIEWNRKTTEEAIAPISVINIATSYFDKMHFVDEGLESKKKNLMQALNEMSASLGDRVAIMRPQFDYQQMNPSINPEDYEIEMIGKEAMEIFQWLKIQKKTTVKLSSEEFVYGTTGHSYILDVIINVPLSLLMSKYIARPFKKMKLDGKPKVIVVKDSGDKISSPDSEGDILRPEQNQMIFSFYSRGLCPGLNSWNDVLESYFQYFDNAYFSINESRNYGKGEIIPFIFLRENIDPKEREELTKDHINFPIFKKQLRHHLDCPTGLASSMKAMMSTLKSRGLIDSKGSDWHLTPLGIEVSNCIGSDFVRFDLKRMSKRVTD